MNDHHHVFIVGPRDGKPQKGMATWFHFVHPDEGRAHELGRTIAGRMSERTGHTLSYHVEPVPHADDEMELLAAADEAIASYPQTGDQPRIEVEATLSCVNDASWAPAVAPLEPRGMAARFVEDLADQNGISLSDWLVVREELPLADEADEEREARIVLSLPAEQAERLLGDDAAVEFYLIRRAGNASPSLYDDDARMEEISADAEDAALNAWGPAGRPSHRPNPHPEGSEEAEHWNRSFMSAYARNNDR